MQAKAFSGKFSTIQGDRHCNDEPGRGKPANGMAKPQPTISRGKRVGLIALGCALGLLLGESIARIAGFEYRPHMRNRVYFTEPDSQLGWRNRAGTAGPYGGDEFSTWVTINADGQRGPHHPRKRSPGKPRVAILGDSQAWGDGVGDAETFAARLDGAETEAVNLGVLGYGTDQQLLSLELALEYEPDLIIVTTYLGNDLDDNSHAGTTQFPKPWFEARDGGLELRGVPVQHSRVVQAGVEVFRALMRHSAILNALAETAANPREARKPDRVTWIQRGYPMHSRYSREPSTDDLAALQLTSRLLIEIGQRADARGAKTIFLILPESWQVEAANDPRWRTELRQRSVDWRRPQKVLRKTLEASGYTVVDALPALARASRPPGSAAVYYPGWKHLTVAGHEVMAELLSPRIASAVHSGRKK